MPTVLPTKSVPADPNGKDYTLIVQTISSNQNVNVDARCNSWTAINKGTEVAHVSGIPLNPPLGAGLSGESFTSPGNAQERYVGRIQVSFDPTDTNPTIVLIQKIYL